MRVSGVGGKICELDELLSTMGDVQKNLEESNDAVKMDTRTLQKARKFEVGQALVDNWLRRRPVSTSEERDRDKSPTSISRNTKWSLLNPYTYENSDDVLDALAASLRETDMARIAVEKHH